MTGERNHVADLCVIGAGSGGLSVAAAAVQLGLDTVLVEEGAMGGDCLNAGCVPSKALLAAARRAQRHRQSDISGIAATEPVIDFDAVKDHVAATIAAIAPHDSQERFENLGVRVIRDRARFIGPTEIRVGHEMVRARRFVIATGSRPVVPPIPGLDPDRVHTNQTIFGLRDRPAHLLVLGGGPIGIEMAQAHRRLGCRVTLMEMASILPQDDEACVRELRNTLIEEGIGLREHTKVVGVRHSPKGVSLRLRVSDGSEEMIEGSHLLVAAGRQPAIDGLDLELAGIACDAHHHIVTDRRLRTTNRRVFVVGDAVGGPQFTHLAGYHAGIVIRNICFGLPARVNYDHLPWVTYTDPELAQAGLTPARARERYGDGVRVVDWPLSDNDRAVAERATTGLTRVVTRPNGRIVGASILAPGAGEQIGIWALAISEGLKIGSVAKVMLPYPTLSEAGKRAAGAWFAPRLFSPRTRFLVSWLKRLNW